LDLLLITLALVALGFCLRYIYEQWYYRKVRKEVRDDVREVHDLTRRLQATTERLNKANADAEAARLRSRPK
jgi:exosome complex RNA-binding protein Rrp42 (RNase PH superfamily)